MLITADGVSALRSLKLGGTNVFYPSELVEGAAEARGEAPIPRDFIVEAMEKIELGEEQAERYPTGMPTLKSIFEVGKKLYEEFSD
ncbi:MAG: hypothetical protein COT88_02350 [Candidatus Colwellbacteria bacterium CG10_big_fil_rev_8_21_14_0_10_41_28]|uniref:Uncharacterized protein n=1 Tax=Candidatus Colwellbacteria bacterium CG10_big_fil_rev_8_21_14_0_10_41_28 TaxID=1974539 RepID=A0A2H0VGY3_9BACT|nr:MAG: hypothetical protein COT88_02350 [Candidatus Colwellbacteria bacterium CG10_big_fil_rev_8_21_14_0_10_41_28]